jgi:precorrin-3B methylase
LKIKANHHILFCGVGQAIHLTTLEQLPTAEVDMQTTVFIGNGSTRRWGNFMFTPRGYGRKYAMQDGAQPACST